ncbi:MAG: cysteine desulfurase NifS [Candidatus Edwardsbacteria bacterium]|nr:cysteine desulfurase NifS [Candidatus Edwardsbacteria bacterium]MBU1576791.1 cysteine desulfurase NifS [Candidatus Edwardsbacteria bacterium]MBU2462698.1 cysteine desulfurase NifS [Candidatus Edwardsbacteria bacterium]MBU2593352.1 cysteine desulfurase NifS [Candidatus Edwardsbacteria bacterium]
MEHIYLDHSATTPVREEVLQAMLPFYGPKFGNPSSIHSLGREVRQSIEASREKVAAALACDPSEVVFTGSGTESDNQAIKGAVFANRDKGDHIITTKIEHHAVLHTFEYLQKHFNIRTTFLGVDRYGLVDPEELRRAINQKTILVSVMQANNEVGTIQPLPELANICRENKVLFHSDAVQAFGKLETDVKTLGVDLLSVSAHKIYGPKGVGALYVKKGTRLHPLIHGGGHEKNRRAGTENVAGIAGLGAAAELAAGERLVQWDRLTALRERLWQGIEKNILHVRRNGHPEKSLPGILNVSFEYIEGEGILLSLDMKGIAASSGSACTSGSLEPSHVLAAMGVPTEIAQGSLRFSIGRGNTEEQMDYTVGVLSQAVARLREMSPIAPRASCGINSKSC